MMRRRCAIYTRTSSEEGLSQDFNSLHAQAEACAAFVKSQAGEGWTLFGKPYEDGGFSGGSLDRPALKRLLADIQAGKIDIVVVYKVDRLTRSLADFARIVEIFDMAGASFVSITQSFNTTTSMGRLTLNVLLSFAQFEREVTGERIRDKFAASKAKGMWMGGVPPLGYDIDKRSLRINEPEAERVRFIYRRYLELGAIIPLVKDLRSQRVFSKPYVSVKGRARGNQPFTYGALAALLSNPIYRGLIRHKGKIYPGQHQAIIDEELWDQVRALYGTPETRKAARPTRALLSGKLWDDQGNAMQSASAHKNGVRYPYYVSAALTRDRSRAKGSLPRIAQTALDRAVSVEVEPLLSRGANISDALERVELSATRIKIGLKRDTIDLLALATASHAKTTLETDERVTLDCPIVLARPRNVTAIIHPGAALAAAQPDRALIRAVTMARVWMTRLERGEPISITKLAAQENLCFIHTSKILPLAFLAPDLVEMILEGRQPQRLTLTALIEERLSMAWDAQRAKFQAFA